MTADSRDPMVGLPAAALPDLHRALASGRSAEEAAAVARQIGFATGPAVHRALGERLSFAGTRSVDALAADEFWTRLSEFFSSGGWGRLAFERLHTGVGALLGEDWIEAEGRSEGQPACHITTGLLADLLSRVAGSDLAVMEVECRATGDGTCRFLVGSPEALSEVYARIRAGSDYTEALADLQ